MIEGALDRVTSKWDQQDEETKLQMKEIISLQRQRLDLEQKRLDIEMEKAGLKKKKKKGKIILWYSCYVLTQ